MILGRVKRLCIDDAVLVADAEGRVKVAAERVDPIGRLGGTEYVTFGELLDIARPP